MNYDEKELIYLYHLGSQEAYDILMERYANKLDALIKKQGKALDVFSPEDFRQEALMMFINVIDKYRDDKHTLPQTYFYCVLNDVIKSKIRSLYSKRKSIYINIISLSQGSRVVHYGEVPIEDKTMRYRPDKALMIKENIEEYQSIVDDCASNLEKSVHDYYQIGYTHNEIADMLGVNIKAVYNAKDRLHAKMNDIVEEKNIEETK